MTQRDLRIRPLSEGIGLGALKTPNPKVHVTDIDTSVMRQAHAAYAPYSVEAEIRKRTISNWYVKAVRFIASTGTDVFIGIFSVFVIAWVSTLAWSAGETGSFDVVGSLNAVIAFLTAQPMTVLMAGVGLLAGCLRLTRYVVERFS